jgi:hypothetical protein
MANIQTKAGGKREGRELDLAVLEIVQATHSHCPSLPIL